MEMNDPLRILFAEDVVTDKEIAEREIKKHQLNIVSSLVDNEIDFRKELEKFNPDIVVSDYSMPHFDGMLALQITKTKDPHIPFLLLTGSNNEEIAVNCMKAGADDYILKDNLHRLVPAIESAIKKCSALKLKEKAEKDLYESEDRFKYVFENSPVAKSLTLPDGKINSNQSFAEMLGYTLDELNTKNWKEITPPEDVAEVQELIDPVLRGEKQAVRFIKRYLHKNGDIKICDLSTSLRRDSVGNPMYFMTTSIDITERIIAEENLKKNQMTHQTIIKTAMDGFWVADTNGRLQEVNQSYCDMSGYTEEELLNLSIYDLEANESELPTIKQMQTLIEKGGARFESKHKRKDGGIIDVEVSAITSEIDKNILFIFIRDITEQKKAETEISNSQQRYKAIFEWTGNATVIVDYENYILMANKECYNLTGYSSDELLGRKWTEFIAEENLDKLTSIYKLRQISPEAAPNKYESYFINKNGEARVVILNIGAIPSSKSFVVSMLDITERKTAEKALIENEKKYRLLFDNNPHPMWVYDLESLKFLAVNQAAVDKYGYTREEFLGMTIKEIRPAEDIEELLKNILEHREVIQEAGVWRHKLKDGSIIYVEIYSHHLVFENKNTRLVLANDVTKRKIIEDQLRISREQFKAYFNSSSVGLSVTAPDKSWIEVNQKLCDMMGYTKSELTTFTWESLTHPDDISVNRELFNKAIDGKIDNYSLDKRFITKEGKIIVVTVSAAVQRDNTGNVHHLLTSYTDITERKLAEQELFTSREKLRALTARLEQVKEEERVHLSRELHDHLGQNLTGLKMEIAYFAKKIKAERFSNPDDLLNKSNEMLGLIDEMINNVRKISAQLRPDVLDYLGLIPAIEWQIGELMRRTEILIELKTEVAKIDLGMLKNSSIFRIVQEAFTNIVRHAQATKVLVSIREATNTYILEILDNGVGVKETDMSNLKSLGVIGMKERTLQFNGKLSIENAPQGGTLLTLVIPKTENIEC